MKKTRKYYNASEAHDALVLMLSQHKTNAYEIHKKSTSNQKVREMCQSLFAMYEALEGWIDLPGDVKIVVAYQPTFGNILIEDDMNDDPPF